MRRLAITLAVLCFCVISLTQMVYATETIEKRSAFEAQFEEIWQLILSRHIKPIEDTPQARINCLFRMISDGLRGCLQDGYSFYYSPDETKAFFSDYKGEVGGVGLKLERRGEYVRIKEIVPNSPAARSGMFIINDLIVAVDGEDMRYVSASYVASRIIGEVGTHAVITVRRDREVLPPIVLTRKRFVIPSVIAKTVGNVEVLKVSAFKFNTPVLFERAAIAAIKRGTRKFVIDLRDNPGGSLNAALSIGCLFSGDPRDVMVTALGRDPEEIRVDAVAGCLEEKRGKLRGMKFVVLVNEESASASEVIAALAKDWKFAKVVGVRTFGKGSIQKTFELSGGSLVQFTIAKYYVGNNFMKIDGFGVEPDIIAKPIPGKRDVQLRAAIEVLNN